MILHKSVAQPHAITAGVGSWSRSDFESATLVLVDIEGKIGLIIVTLLKK